MNLTFAFSNRFTTKQYLLFACFTLPLLAGGAAAFPGDYLLAGNVLIGVALFPFVIFFNGEARLSYFFLVCAIAFAGLSWFYHIRIFYFFSLAFYVLMVLEFFFGRINSLILFLIVLMSPFFNHIAVMTGFPLRLFLSKCAGSILVMAGVDVKVEGNMMLLQNHHFAVDDACMGLHMLSISMLMGVLILSHQYRILQRNLSLAKLLLFFGLIFGFNLFSNLTRILVLVLFKIDQDQILHEIVGIIFLVIYVVIPSWYLSKFLVARYGSVRRNDFRVRSFSSYLNYSIMVLAIPLSCIGFTIDPGKSAQEIQHPIASMAGLNVLNMKEGITRLSNEKVLIYIKPIPEFFSLEHTPLFCWKGSGYQFEHIKKELIAGKEIYTGQLKKEAQTLQTAWWYTDGEMLTIDQVEWRTRMLKKGNRFYLINVSTNDLDLLHTTIESIFRDKILVVN